MDKKFEHIEDVIAKFLAGEAVAEEIALIEEWKMLNAENEREFFQFEKLFNESSKLGGMIDTDTDAAWKRVSESVRASRKGKVIKLHGPKQFPAFLRIAAILLLVAGLGISVYFFTNRVESNFVNVTTTDSVKVLNLPDGSLLTLNQNSTVSYSIDASSNKRIVRLIGEAFFEVKHDSLSPFIVETEHLEIKDVGTAFNVKSNMQSKVVIVSVVEGEVQLTISGNNPVFVSAGEEALYNISENRIEMSKHVDKNIAAYKDKIFIFENAQLSEVLKVLSEIYDIQMEMSNDSLQNCRLTVTFNNEQADVVADVIAETLGLTISKEPGKFIFSGDACK